jgi:hypothetical protein
MSDREIQGRESGFTGQKATPPRVSFVSSRARDDAETWCLHQDELEVSGDQHL